MHLVQILLPLCGNSGEHFSRNLFDQVRDELMDKFSGLTAYTRTPVSGLWQEGKGETVHDENVIYEVIVKNLDRDWWAGYRSQLEKRFQQEQLVVRAHRISML
jgi:hypothetical protein